MSRRLHLWRGQATGVGRCVGPSRDRPGRDSPSRDRPGRQACRDRPGRYSPGRDRPGRDGTRRRAVWPPFPASSATVPALPLSTTPPPIHHVVEIMLENHSFDNLFGRSKGANGIPTRDQFPEPHGPWRPGEPSAGTGQPGQRRAQPRQFSPAEQRAMDRQPNGTFAMDRFTSPRSTGWPPSPSSRPLSTRTCSSWGSTTPSPRPTSNPRSPRRSLTSSPRWPAPQTVGTRTTTRPPRTGSTRFLTSYRRPGAPGTSSTECRRPCSKGRSGTS